MVKLKFRAQGYHFALTSFVLALLTVLLIPSSAKAQQCSDILQRGIYDISTTSSETSLSESFLSLLSKQEIRTEQDARGFASKVGVVLPTEVPIPVELGIDSSGSSTRTYGQALSEFFSKNVDRRDRFNQEFRKVNPNVIAAWSDCVRNRKGLVCWADQTKNPNEVYLNIEFRPIAIPVPTLTIRSITTSPNVSARENVIDEKLSTNVFPVIFVRTGSRRNDAANFTVRTNDPNYACTAEVDGIPEAPPPPLARVTVNTPQSNTTISRDAVTVDFNPIILTEGQRISSIIISLIDVDTSRVVRTQVIGGTNRTMDFQLHYVLAPDENGAVTFYPQTFRGQHARGGILHIPHAQFEVTVVLESGSRETARSGVFTIDRR